MGLIWRITFFFFFFRFSAFSFITHFDFFRVVSGATAFVLSLLEPDPEKRPSVRDAMEDKWINEGYAKKPLHALSYKNR